MKYDLNFYKLLLDKACDWEILTSPEGEILYSSPSGEEVAGYSQAEFMKDKELLRKIVFKEDLPVYDSHMGTVAKKQECGHFDYRIVKKDNGIKWISHYCQPIHSDSGVFIGRRISNRDISGRKLLEQEREASEQKFRKLFDINPNPVSISLMDNGKYYDVNEAFLRVTGFSREEVIGRTSIELNVWISPEDRKRYIDRLESEGGIKDMDVRYRMKSGEIRDFMISSEKIIYDGRACAFNYIVDITERRRAEERLKESEEKYRSLFSEMGQGFALHEIIMDANGIPIDYVTTDVNDSFCKMLKAVKGDVIGRKAGEILPPGELRKWLGVFGPVALGEGSRHYEMHSPHNDRIFQGFAYSPERGKFAVIFEDITERKRYEERIKESRNLLMNVIDSSADYIFVKDTKLRIMFANKMYAQAVGREAEELVGKEDEDIWPAEFVSGDASKGLQGFKNSDLEALGGRVVHIEDDLLKIKGKARVFDTIKLPLRDAAGNITGLLGVSRDVTERKKNEDLLRIQKDIFVASSSAKTVREAAEAILENTIKIEGIDSGGLYIADGSGGLELVAHKGLCDEFVGKVLKFSKDSPQARMTKRGEPIYSEYQQLKISDDEKRKEGIRALAVLPVMIGKNMVAVLNAASHSLEKLPAVSKKSLELTAAQIGEIITKLAAEESLRQSELKYRQLVELATEGIWSIDENAITLYANPSMEKMLGYGPGEMAGKSLFDFMDKWGRIMAEENIERRKKGLAEQHDFQFVAKDGKKVITSISTSPVMGEKGEYRGAIALVTDITEKRKNEEERENIRRRLIENDKMAGIGTLAGGVAHEFNNILQIIRGNAEVFGRTAEAKEPDENIKNIIEYCDKASGIISDLMSFSRKDRDTLETFSIKESVEAVLSLTRKPLGKLNIEVKLQAREDAWVEANRARLQQAFLHIIMNARDAMEKEGGKLTVSIKPAKETVEIAFKDTGCGINKEHMSRLFEPFFTTKGSLGQSAVPGTGLGLYVAYGAVTDFGGSIEVSSKEGKGAEFTITLPRKA